MSKFKLKQRVKTPEPRITRIEIRGAGKSKVLNLEHVNSQTLFNHVYQKLSELTTNVTMKLPIVESPLLHVRKCRIQVFEAATDSIPKKENFHSFTCYGIDNAEAAELISKIIQES